MLVKKMSNPLNHLTENISLLTATQKKVADYILQHPSEVAFLTVDQLARKVQTSSTTIMRLTFALGYSGYSEFQKGLQSILRDKSAPHTRLETNLKDVDQDDLWGNVINHHLNQIQNMVKIIPQDRLNLAVDKIINARKIYCASVRSGMPVGQYITHGLNRSLGNCKLFIPDTSDWIDEIINMNDTDLIIASSFPRYAKRIIDFVKVAKENGVTIIAITDNYSAPIVQYSDLVFPCNSSSIAFHNSPVAAMIFADFLISAVAIKNATETKKRLDKVNKLLTDINYHHFEK